LYRYCLENHKINIEQLKNLWYNINKDEFVCCGYGFGGKTEEIRQANIIQAVAACVSVERRKNKYEVFSRS
jgi:hypothetical protein